MKRDWVARKGLRTSVEANTGSLKALEIGLLRGKDIASPQSSLSPPYQRVYALEKIKWRNRVQVRSTFLPSSSQVESNLY